jgi:hypothetical protein
MDMDHRRGLQEVRVIKTELVAKIQENYEKHKADFQESLAGWREQYFDAIAALAAAADQADTDTTECRRLQTELNSLDKPKSHRKDYERTLELLAASQDEEFVLDVTTFNQYWRDDWRWKGAFETSNAKYSSRR